MHSSSGLPPNPRLCMSAARPEASLKQLKVFATAPSRSQSRLCLSSSWTRLQRHLLCLCFYSHSFITLIRLSLLYILLTPIPNTPQPPCLRPWHPSATKSRRNTILASLSGTARNFSRAARQHPSPRRSAMLSSSHTRHA